MIFYYQWHWPLALVQFLLGLIFGDRPVTEDPSMPGVREWYSQPRTGADSTVEVVTVVFKLPLSLSEVAFEALRVPCRYELWYQDRSNNWRPLLNRWRMPSTAVISGSDVRSWYHHQTDIYPVVAKKVQVRITRIRTSELAEVPYVVGMRELLLRRNVYDRSQGTTSFEDEVDIMGNVISKYIKDWDAAKAHDDNATTFWRSAPQPDPSAVVGLTLDVRNKTTGDAQTIDRLYIDPVHSGQHLNLYYSSDDTVGTRKLSPITRVASADQNTSWRMGRGRHDDATGSSSSFYRWQMDVGMLFCQDAWIGVEWTPDFDPAAGPAQNPVLLRSVPDIDPVPNPQWHPGLIYDVGAGEFKLVFDDGSDQRVYTAALTQLFVPGEPLRIVAGWSYDPSTVYISVKTRDGTEIAALEDNPTTLPTSVSVSGTMEMADFRGMMTATVIKLAHWGNASAFQNGPQYYTNPDPVLPEADGSIPSSSLDNAVYAAAWPYQEHGTGGGHESHFADKEWTPIWRDYISEKGMLFFPRAYPMKYLKLEFTNLTEEPYPIYESGTEVRYKVYPISVLQQSSQGWHGFYSGAGGVIGMGRYLGPQMHVNWMDPGSINDALNAIIGRRTDPVLVQTGPAFITDTLPNSLGITDVTNTYRLELNSTVFYRREQLDPYVIASDEYYTTVKAEGLMKIADYTEVPWTDIEAANRGAITHKRSAGALPIRGTDWWIFPGQQLKIPAYVMTKLTDTETVVERKYTTERRVRFTTVSTHRYEWKTLKRDAAIAYFAGVREVQPFTTSYIDGDDPDFFEFTSYDPLQWVTQRTRMISDGPTTTVRKNYEITNSNFDRNILGWTTSSENWHWDTWGHYAGCLAFDTTGLNEEALSTHVDVVEGDQIRVSCWVQWEDLAPDDNTEPIRLAGKCYLAGELTDEGLWPVFDVVSYADWSAHPDSPVGPWGVKLEGTWTVPEGVDELRIRPQVTEDAPVGGKVKFDTVYIGDALANDPGQQATLYKRLETTSTFAKVMVEFRDSGLVRSNDMWARDDPLNTNIDETQLAYYTEITHIPEGMWADAFRSWEDSETAWGSPYPLVSITLDGDRRYQGKRVLRLRRVAGAGEAGVKVRQWTHFVPGALARIGCVFYKPTANDNEATLRLRRMSDGVFIYEEVITAPAGRWVEYLTRFFEIPADDDPAEIYQVSMTMTGDDEDELYLNDLYVDLAHLRYFIRLGGLGSSLIEVTDLRYANGRAQTSTVFPVNEMSIQAVVLSERSVAYGARVTPLYLK